MKPYAMLNLVSGCWRALPFFLLLMSLSGCSFNHVNDLQPSGPISRNIDELFWTTVALMSLVLISVFGMAAWFVWKYRASNTKAKYSPDWDTSLALEWLVWLFPALIIVILGSATWIFTHRLDPYKPMDSKMGPLEIQVIALDWKWLFIYPEQRIAVVNELAIPVGRPIAFKITSDTVMNSFFIPRLGGQINAMAGMQTQLHLIADQPGRYLGENIQYSGSGFSYQHFEVNATSLQGFETWMEKAKQSPQTLDFKQFKALAKPSIRHPVTYFSSVSPMLFKQVMDQFLGEPNLHPISDQ